MKILLPIVIILAVAGITFLTVWFRYDQLAQPTGEDSTEVPPQGLFSFAFTMAAALFGGVVAVGYYFATGWWKSADSILFWTAIGFTVLFSIGAVIVRTQVVKGGALESVVLNLAWGLGYGWVLPMVMRTLGFVR